jgi:hypothetical protein
VQVRTNQNHQADLVVLAAAAAAAAAVVVAVAEDLRGEVFVKPVHSDTQEKDP